MSEWTVLLLVALGLSVAVWYLSFSASRLDRLHHRVRGARAALDNQLLRRSGAAGDLASSGLLDPATSLLLAGAAADAAAAGEQDPATVADESLVRDERAREAAESDLTRALRAALGDRDQVAALTADPLAGPLLQSLEAASHRVRLARRFHNDAVAQAQRVRNKRVVRWARLSGHAGMPQTFEMDDDPPVLLSTS